MQLLQLVSVLCNTIAQCSCVDGLIISSFAKKKRKRKKKTGPVFTIQLIAFCVCNAQHLICPQVYFEDIGGFYYQAAASLPTRCRVGCVESELLFSFLLLPLWVVCFIPLLLSPEPHKHLHSKLLSGNICCLILGQIL